MEWIEEARISALQCWGNKKIDILLVEAVAEHIAGWMDTVAQTQRNADYYRGLVVRCGKAIGRDAYIQDDGGECDEVLCAKVPELVEEITHKEC